MKKVLFAFILLVAVLVAGNATAVPIDGTIGFFGTFSPTGGSGLGDATGIAFPRDLIVSGIGTSGDFSAFAWGSAAFSSFEFKDDDGANVLSPSPVYSLWQVPATGPVFSFDLYSINVDLQTDEYLVLNGIGILHGVGFDDTPGTWNFWGTSEYNINFSFSADSGMSMPMAHSIPDPSAMVLLGSACLIFFVGTRRQRD